MRFTARGGLHNEGADEANPESVGATRKGRGGLVAERELRPTGGISAASEKPQRCS